MLGMTPIEAEAAALFRIVHGPGDEGSPREFWAQNPGIRKGWLRLAKSVRKKIREAETDKFTRVSLSNT